STCAEISLGSVKRDCSRIRYVERLYFARHVEAGKRGDRFACLLTQAFAFRTKHESDSSAGQGGFHFQRPLRIKPDGLESEAMKFLNRFGQIAHFDMRDQFEGSGGCFGEDASFLRAVAACRNQRTGTEGYR